MALDYFSIEQKIGVPDLTTIYETLEDGASVGMITKGYSPVLGDGTFILLAGVASLEVGDAVVYNSITGDVAHTIAASHKNTGFPVAFSLTANTGSTKYSWFQIQGNAIARSDDVVVANTPAYIKSTAGLVDDAVNAGGQILGARIATVKNATVNGHVLGADEFIISINYPHIQSGAVS